MMANMASIVDFMVLMVAIEIYSSLHLTAPCRRIGYWVTGINT
jgi:hypothetical protein